MSLIRSCLVLAVALSFGVSGCARTSSSTVVASDTAAAIPAGEPLPPEGREVILNVAGQRAPCTGVAPMLCLQVRTQPGAAWQLHHGEIEGFNWQPGTEYVIRVRELPVANPPADGASRRWVLVQLLDSGPAL